MEGAIVSPWWLHSRKYASPRAVRRDATSIHRATGRKSNGDMQMRRGRTRIKAETQKVRGTFLCLQGISGTSPTSTMTRSTPPRETQQTVSIHRAVCEAVRPRTFPAHQLAAASLFYVWSPVLPARSLYPLGIYRSFKVAGTPSWHGARVE